MPVKFCDPCLDGALIDDSATIDVGESLKRQSIAFFLPLLRRQLLFRHLGVHFEASLIRFHRSGET
jgi:hypothetical protein